MCVFAKTLWPPVSSTMNDSAMSPPDTRRSEITSVSKESSSATSRGFIHQVSRRRPTKTNTLPYGVRGPLARDSTCGRVPPSGTVP